MIKIHSYEHIEERVEFIQNYIEAYYENDDGNKVNTRLSEVGAFLAEAGKLVADAEYYYNDALQNGILNALENQMPAFTSATVQNKLASSLAKKQRQLFKQAERLNASCVHQLDSMRTQLSYLKSLPR